MKKYIISLLLPLLLLGLCLPIVGQKPNLIIPTGHSRAVISFDFSSDGKYLLTGSLDGTVKLWNVQSGQELQNYCGPKGYQVSEAQLTPDNKKVVIGASDGVVFIFDTFSGAAISTFSQTDLGEVKALAISPDGQKVWSAHQSMLVYWKLNSGEILFKSGVHTQDIKDIAIAPNGQTGISVGEGQTAILWNLNDFRPLKNLAGHTSDVIWTDYVNDGQYAVTADRDKNLWYWDPQTGNQVGGTSIVHSGSLESLAISENNQYLLTQTNGSIDPGGNDAKLWRITDAGLQLLHSLDGGTTDKAIAISPDKQFIVSGSWNTGEAQLWDLSSGQSRQFYKSHAQTVSTTYLTDRQLITVSNDFWGTIKVFDLQQNKDVTIFMEDNQSAITSSALSKDGKLLFANQVGESNVLIFDLETLVPLKPFYSPVGPTISLDLSSDQQYLATSSGNAAYLWNWRTGEQIKSFEGHDSDVFQVAISPDQRFLFTSTPFSGNLWDLNSRQKLLPDLMKSEDGETEMIYAFSNNGQYLAVGNWQKGIQVWDLNTQKEVRLIKSPSEGGFSSFNFSKDSRSLIAGEWNGDIQVYNIAKGNQVEGFSGYGNQVQNLNISGENGFVLSSSQDQTTKILKFNSSTTGPSTDQAMEEKAQLISLGKKDWAIVTPDGLFDASPGAMELMYFVVSNQNDYEVMELEQLKSRYRDPGLLQKILGKVNEPIRDVQGLQEVDLYPELKGTIEEDQLQLQLKERTGKIGRVTVFINDKEVIEDISNRAKQNGALTEITLDLKPYDTYLWANPSKKNVVSVEVTNQEGWLKSKRLELAYPKYRQSRGTGSDGTAWIGTENPNMYIISVGTSDYTDTILDLRYADQDAAAMAKALYSSGKQLFNYANGIEAYCLTTHKEETLLANTTIEWSYPSKENINKVFETVRQKSKPEDIVVVYFSGHGVTFGPSDQVQFYYLTQAFANEELINVADTRKKYAISSDELTDWLKKMPALKQVLIIDACNSGNVVQSLMAGSRNLNSSQIRAIDRMQDRTGMYVLSGSAANKVSYEASEFGQGLLTYSLLNGMRSAALRVDQNGEKLIDVIQLFNHARDEVPQLAKSIQGIQTPMLGFPKEVASVDIGIYNDQVDIPIADKKPIFISSNFLNQNTMVDDSKLNELVSNAFRKEAEKGKNANFLFFPVNEYPNAYQVTGLYEMVDGQIQLRAKLTQKGAPSIDLSLKPANNAEQLVKILLSAINKNLD
jgi:WD40 repeat protein/uncharacterized caspase-like protein